MSRIRRLGAARALAVHALGHGASHVSPSLIQWDVSGRCEAPVWVEIEGRPDTRKGETGMPIAVVLETRCRQCSWCLKRRAWEWRCKAQAEIAASVRTWFGTITLNAQEHYWAMCSATARLTRAGVSFDGLAATDQFRERHREIGYLLTKWLKRVRKNSGATLRFCLVAEAHKSGLPHYHVLVHETSQATVTKRTLQEGWPHGFTQFKLVEDGPGASAYVTKYLTKSAMARVRASLRYGRENALSGIVASEATRRETSPLPNKSIL